MIFHKVTTHNFRNLYGTQELQFADDPKSGKKLTIIHGTNGGGKTTYLNTFVWCLYGDFAPGTKKPESLCTELAIAEAKVGATINTSVEIEFSKGGVRYWVTRKCSWVKKEQGSTINVLKSENGQSLHIMERELNGETVPAPGDENVLQNRINALMPKALHSFFFFNGEKLEDILTAQIDAVDKIRLGMEGILDIAPINRAVEHLENKKTGALSVFDEVIASFNIEELNLLKTELTEREKELETSLKTVQDTAAEKSACLALISDIELRISEIAAAAAAQAAREKADGLLKQQRAMLKDNKIDERDQISDAGFTILAGHAMELARIQVGAAEATGELPADIKPRFVKKLVFNKKCICTRPLLKDTDFTKAVEEWVKTGVGDFEAAIDSTDAVLNRYEGASEDSRKKLEKITSNRLSITQKIDAYTDEIRAAGEAVSGASEEAALLNRQLAQENHRDGKLDTKLFNYKADVKSKQTSISKLNDQINQLETSEEGLTQAQRRRASVMKISGALKDISNLRVADACREISAEMQDAWREQAYDWVPQLTPEYKLVMTRPNGDLTTGLSMGQGTMLSVYFLVSLIKYHQQLQAQKSDVVVDDEFALVIDSPFGSLAGSNREHLLSFSHEHVSQVIIMVSDTQWNGRVKEYVESTQALQYLVELQSTKNTGEPFDHDGSEELYYIRSNSGYDREISLLKEVK